jgi:hypothetical protein
MDHCQVFRIVYNQTLAIEGASTTGDILGSSERSREAITSSRTIYEDNTHNNDLE